MAEPFTYELSLPPGMVLDDSTFSAKGRWADGSGFRFRLGKPEVIGSAALISSGASTTDANKLLMVNHSGTIKIVRAGDFLIVSPPNVSGTDITPLSGWTTGTITLRRSLAMWGNILLASTSGGTLFQSNLTARGTAIANAPDNITCFVVTTSRQVMALGCNEEGSGTFNGRCIRWCDIEDFDNWTTSSTNNAGEFILSGQANIVGGCAFGDSVLVWTQSSLWVGRFLGDPLQPWDFEKVASVGMIGQDAFAILHQTVYWIGRDGAFYSYTDGGLAQQLLCPIASALTPESKALDPVLGASAFGCANSLRGEVWFSIPLGSIYTQVLYAVYCVQESAAAGFPVWFKGEYDLPVVTANSSPAAMVESALPWDPAGTYGTDVIVVHASTTDSALFAWDCSTDGRRGIEGAYIQTSDMYIDLGKRRVMMTRCRPDFDAIEGAVSLTLYMRDYAHSEPVTKGPYTLAVSTAIVTGLVNDSSIASGDDDIDVQGMSGAMAKGVTFTFAGVNEYDGGDTGELMVFTVAQDFEGGDGTLHFTPAAVSTGASRNVVAMPGGSAAVTALKRNGKKDFRASGKIMAARFTTLVDGTKVRFGVPMFDCVPLGMR